MRMTRLVITLIAASLLTQPGCKRENVVTEDKETTSVARPAFSHEGFTRTCIVCHQKQRPSLPHEPKEDCVRCHNPGTYWLDLKTFSHAPLPTSCARCHEDERPVLPALILTPHGFGNDCAGCHTAGTQWTDLKKFDHLPTPGSCIGCHEKSRPLTTTLPNLVSPVDQHFGTQDCASCHQTPRTEEQVFSFEHRTAEAKVIQTCLPCHEPTRKNSEHYAGKDCAGCHINPALPWKRSLANPHPENNPAPPICASCHVGWRPATVQLPGTTTATAGHFDTVDCVECHLPASATVTAFIYNHRATGTAPTSCTPCHEAQRPTAMVSSFLHSVAGKGDCSACHSHPGERWNDGFFSHSPVPAQCSVCHESERPTQLVNRFLHSVTGATDCVQCHHRPGFTWADGTYSHSPVPATCSACHAAQRPSTIVQGFDHAMAGQGDCKPCHTNPGNTWAGATFSHTNVISCSVCHEGRRPLVLVNRFIHSIAGTGDCFGCHLKPGDTWAGGVYNHAPKPATCDTCHGPERPANVTASGFDHRGGCSNCHNDFHLPYDCSRCHLANAGINWKVDPVTVTSSYDCDGCHAPSVGMAPPLGPTSTPTP